VNDREQRILSQRLQAVGKLRNALLGDLLGRLTRLRSDRRYRAAIAAPASKHRSKALAALRREYELTPNGARSRAFRHWQASGWMPRVIDSRIALALASEVLAEVEAHAYRRAGQPRFRRAIDRDVVWGNDNRAGLRYLEVEQAIIWPQPQRGKRKDLRIGLPPAWRFGRPQHEKHLAGKRVVRVGLKREMIRGRIAWFALICIAGRPYRSPQPAPRKIIGIDFGPSRVAVSARGVGEVIELITDAELESEKEAARKRRHRQRALDRSRRAMNPDAYDDQGRAIRGKRPRKTSKRGRRLAGRDRDSARKAATRRRQRGQRIARQIVSQGRNIALERIDYSAWQRSWFGRRMSLTVPGQLEQQLRRESALVGGKVIELPLDLALSQHCLCGARVKKPLSVRTHACPRCGLGGNGAPLDRDLFSAFLARLCAQNPGKALRLSEGPFGTAGYRREANRHCRVCPRPAPSRSSRARRLPSHPEGDEARDSGLAGDPAVQTPAQHPSGQRIEAQRARSGRRTAIRSAAPV